MEGKILFTYGVALVLSVAALMCSVGNLIQVFKLNTQTQDPSVRKDNLLWFLIFGALTPVGSTFATGFSFISGFSLFTVLAGILAVLQMIAVGYMVNEAIPLCIVTTDPADAAKVTKTGS